MLPALPSKSASRVILSPAWISVLVLCCFWLARNSAGGRTDLSGESFSAEFNASALP